MGADSTSTGLAEKRTTRGGDAGNRPPGYADAQAASASGDSAEVADAGGDGPEVGRAQVGSAGTASAGTASAQLGTAQVDSAGRASAEVAGARVAGSEVDPAGRAGANAARSEESDAAPDDDDASGTTAGTIKTSARPGAGVADSEPTGGAESEPDIQVSVVPGIARYHTADCILIRFLSAEDLQTMTRQAAEGSGCAPCRACRPDKASADA
jgi:hypothetical protein